MTDKDRLWHMWRRYYELPVRIRAVRGVFVFHCGPTVYADKTLEGAMKMAGVLLRRQGVKPFSEFGCGGR
jgi:hypothetical protein